MLTRKEQQTFDFITKYHKKFGESPLLRQIAEGIGIKSKGVAHRYVEALVKERKIKKFPYRHRGNIINQKKSLNGLRIKSFGKIVAGSPIDAVSDKDIIELDHIFSNEKCFALKVQGNSMIEAGVNDGDWVESCTALVEHFDGSLELIDWNKKRKEIINITTNGANKKLLRKTA